ncbi:hypothetical protein HYDPIDRAFT_41144 [Hydnomerulius pinastri MD-312]|uniref:Unplaced genomic scaffold scaffold_17, whole genome shotgun sequence n=1 Tax=Hydnomerulius pinastri MD-312 TaxID=994086 RepID=A0A0C9VCG2_9AGAM|nr:hypothetical protein HYDPIDRAFT_41144 [Hydnomerulius pinastri MD-312]
MFVIPCQWKGLLLLLSTLITSARADYFIDDTNVTLTYASGPKAAWAPYASGATTVELLLPNGTYQVVDPSVCYNHTYRYAACFDTDSCLLTVPFTGSGITVYVYQAGPVGINASITIDGAHAATTVLNAPPAPAYEIANVSMFNVQQLQTGPHTLSLLINDLFGSYSGMMFDYAYVNETLVSSPTTSSGTPTSTTGPSTSISPSASTAPSGSSSGTHTDIGAIVGGVIGGIAVIMAGIIAFFCMRRRRSSDMIDLNAEAKVAPYDPSAAYDPPSNQFQSTHGLTSRGTIHNTASLSSVPLAPNRRDPSVDQLSGPNVVSPFTSSASNSSGYQDRDRKSRLVLSNDTPSPASAPSGAYADPGSQSSPETVLSPQSARRDLSPSLTDEQADFINSLYNNNVPAAAIARVMERMLVDRNAGIREWERETRLSRANTFTTAPPSYDFANDQ